MAEKKNVVINKTDAVFVKQSKETELGTMTRRIELAIGNTNRLMKAYPDEMAKIKKALLSLEGIAHALWLAEARTK